MINLKKIIQLSFILGSSILYGCSSSEEPTQETVSSGTFTTPKVKGLKYTTDTQSGFTDENGTYKYKDGEKINFYIGNTFVGTAYASNMLSPLDLSQSLPDNKSAPTTKVSNINDNWAINLFNLLLSLDSNGDTSDGIEITEAVHTLTSTLTLQLDLPPDDFIADSATVNFTVAVSISLNPPADVSTFVSMNYSNNSDWGTMVWGTSSWSAQ